MTLPKRLRACKILAKAILSGYILFALCLPTIIYAQGLNNVDDIIEEENTEEDHKWLNDDGLVVVVGSPYVELYRFPGRGYPRFHAIEKHERILLFKSRSDWYKIETQDGKIGWTPRKYLHTLYDLEGNLLDFSTPTWGENKDKWQLGLLGGSIEGALSYTLFTGYRFTPNISTELRFTQTFGDFSNAKQAHLMLVHQPFPRWRVTPFFTLGAGVVQVFPDTTLVEAEDEQDLAITVGGGLIGYLTHNVLLRFDYNSHTLLTTRKTNEEVEEWKVGFSVLF